MNYEAVIEVGEAVLICREPSQLRHQISLTGVFSQYTKIDNVGIFVQPLIETYWKWVLCE